MLHSTLLTSLLLLSATIPSTFAVPTHHLSPRQSFRNGRGTWYTPNGGYGACGRPLDNDEMIAAIPAATYDAPRGASCNRCAEVRGNGKSVRVVIQDRCEGCQIGDIDLSEGAFKRLGDLSVGVLSLDWDFVDCNDGETYEMPPQEPPDGGDDEFWDEPSKEEEYQKEEEKKKEEYKKEEEKKKEEYKKEEYKKLEGEKKKKKYYEEKKKEHYGEKKEKKKDEGGSAGGCGEVGTQVCKGSDFKVCTASGEWVAQSCAPGTTCIPMGGDRIVCGFSG
ncbi:hypothetical protein HDV05_002912 [Chytridiales sp. JEL 0842]|nr:hypothetical protein HDV05_002912 [Chytridiales sp. JEL 0842]